MSTKGGFTIVEVLIVIIVIAILAAIGVVAYNGMQHRATAAVVSGDTQSAAKKLEVHKITESTYPHNLSGTGYVSAPDIGMTLYTNTPYVGVYENLEPSQNAQLFINVCNGNIANTPNTSCTYIGTGNGAKVHVAGTEGSNTTDWPIPVAASDIVLTCGNACTAAQNNIIQQFQFQGGTFPVSTTGNVPMPKPTLVPNGQASRYCLESHSARFTDIVYSISSDDRKLKMQECPSDPDLHYFPE